MRALSLTSLAALAILAACSETTAPPDSGSEALQTPETLSASMVDNGWYPSEPYVFEGCGETLTYVGELDHIIIDETLTPSGRSHWGFRIQTSGGMIYADPSGDVYRANPFAGHGIFNEDLEGNKFAWAGGSTAVARGVNVDKRLKIKEDVKVVVTPDGTVIHDYIITTVECR